MLVSSYYCDQIGTHRPSMKHLSIKYVNEEDICLVLLFRYCFQLFSGQQWSQKCLKWFWVKMVWLITLLVLVTQPPGLVGSCWPRHTMDSCELPVLPAADAKEVAHDIALLLAIQLRHVLVRTHLEGLKFVKIKNFIVFSYVASSENVVNNILCEQYFMLI